MATRTTSSSRTSTTVAWTDAGRAALAAERALGVTLWNERADRELDEAIAKTIARDRAAWHRGLVRGDAAGEAAVAYALGARAPASIDEAAGFASLLGASESQDVAPYAELLVRRRGVGFAIAVLVAMWARATSYTGRSTDADYAIYLRAMPPDDASACDASVSYAKARFATYLARRAPDGIAAAVAAAWPRASPIARAPIAVAAQDRRLAADAARALLAQRRGPHPHFAKHELAYLVTDAKLAAKLDAQPCYRLIESLGGKALPIFERAIASRVDKRTRGRYLEQLANLRGARVAKLVAEYEDSYPELARAYFTAHRDLLERIIADPELRYHREALMKLRDA